MHRLLRWWPKKSGNGGIVLVCFSEIFVTPISIKPVSGADLQVRQDGWRGEFAGEQSENWTPTCLLGSSFLGPERFWKNAEEIGRW